MLNVNKEQFLNFNHYYKKIQIIIKYKTSLVN